MNEQTETAMHILSDIYGYPKWETNTKDGQSADEIMKLWADELGHYSVEQVKQACYRLAKYRKAMTFPTISHLMAELCDEEKEKDTENEPQRVLKVLLNRQPPFDEDVIQRVMWMSYKMKYKNYEPDKDKLLGDEYKSSPEVQENNELTGYGHLIKKINEGVKNDNE